MKKVLLFLIFSLIAVNGEAATYFTNNFITWFTSIRKSESKFLCFIKIFFIQFLNLFANIALPIIFRITFFLSWMLQQKVCSLMRKKLQVLNPVVVLNSINMVNNFFFSKVPAKMLLHYKAVFFYSSLLIFKRMIRGMNFDIPISITCSPFKMPRFITFNKLSFGISHKLSSFLLFCIITFLPLTVNATVYYVRTGGSTNTNCTGLADVDYDGSGTGEACAFEHPNYALGWYQFGSGTPSGGQAGVMVGGDDLYIAPGTYDFGLAVAAFSCSSGFGYDCTTRPVPSGTSGDHTTINGNGGTPKFTGTGRLNFIFTLVGKSYIDINDIEITDTGECMNGHPSLGCGSADDAELTVRNGIQWAGSDHILLHNVNIHGLWHSCLYGTSTDSVISGSSHFDFCYGGLDMDTCSNDGTCGLTAGDTFSTSGNGPSDMTSFNWNGCVESASSPGTAVASGCCNGGSCYGDAFAGSYTAGDWSFDYVEFKHNSSDGLDLRYNKADGNVTITNSYFGGNAGNQLKVSGNWDIKNSVIEGNCDFFNGKSYQEASHTDCQSSGDAMYLGLNSGDTNRFYGNSVVNVVGNVAMTIAGGFLAESGHPTGYTCSGSDVVDIKNSIFSSPGRSSTLGGGTSGFVYECPIADSNCNECESSSQTQTQSNIYGFSSNPTGTGNVFTDSLLSGTFNGSTAAVYLSSSSPARDIADEGATGQASTDINGYARGASWDAGALEYGSTPSGGGGGGSSSTGKTISGALRINGGLRL